MRDVTVAITEASYSGNKGAAAMLQSSISQLKDYYGERLDVRLMSVYPKEDRLQVPFDCVKIISAKPYQVLFIAFPLAVLFKAFHRIKFLRRLFFRNNIIKSYSQTDIVLNEAGVSMVDSRGFVMNVYSFVCSMIPMLMGVRVIKYCQALGTFEKLYNRLLSKWQLPKFNLIIARGEITRQNLEKIGVIKNVTVCADGAFSMPDDEMMANKVDRLWKTDPFFKGTVIGLSISVVVSKKCKALGIDYPGIISEFIRKLNEKGYHVLIIANAARINSTKTRTNDLMLGDEIFRLCSDNTMVKWYHEEMTAEELREHIGRCKYLVASRFHSMIAALEREVPVMLVGWSHKYKEVLDMFELGEYAADYSKLSCDVLVKGFDEIVKDEAIIRRKLSEHIGEVRASSKDNIRLICKELDQIIEKEKNYDRTGEPGPYISIKRGYALKDEHRKNCASGGLVTALLCNMIRRGDIDGAWVTKTVFVNGKVSYKTYIATSEEEICEAASSVYLNVPMMKHLDIVRNFPGKIAVVMQPCMLKALDFFAEREPELKKKIVLKIGLFCSGTCNRNATDIAIKKSGITTDGATRLFYRLGFWRGPAFIEYQDGHRESFSYTRYFCTYKNAYFFSKTCCFSCSDHFAEAADISFGDVWLKEMKKETHKNTACIVRSENAFEFMKRAEEEGYMKTTHMGERDLLLSQKRALAFKYRVCPDYARKHWNEKLAYYLARYNHRKSIDDPNDISKWPQPVMFVYMCFIRWLLDQS